MLHKQVGVVAVFNNVYRVARYQVVNPAERIDRVMFGLAPKQEHINLLNLVALGNVDGVGTKDIE